MKLGNITSQVFQTFWSENLCNEETYHIMTRIYRTLDDRPALGSHNIEMNIQINKYTCNHDLLTSIYKAKSSIMKARFYLFINSLTCTKLWSQHNKSIIFKTITYLDSASFRRPMNLMISMKLSYPWICIIFTSKDLWEISGMTYNGWYVETVIFSSVLSPDVTSLGKWHSSLNWDLQIWKVTLNEHKHMCIIIVTNCQTCTWYQLIWATDKDN